MSKNFHSRGEEWRECQKLKVPDRSKLEGVRNFKTGSCQNFKNPEGVRNGRFTNFLNKKASQIGGVTIF